MDPLLGEVETLRRDLHGSRAKLNELEAGIRESIHPKVGEVQSAMSRGYHRVQSVLTQLQHFDLICSAEASSEESHRDLDLRPQIQWLSQQLGVISERLEVATKATTEARDDTVDYVTRVSHVGERIRHTQVGLETTQSGLQELASKAYSHLCSIRQDMAATEAEARALQGEIRQKTREVAGKRIRLLSPMFKQAVKQYQTASTRNKAKAKKSKAFSRFKTGLKGLLFAPPTLGLSLIVSVVSAGSGVSKLIQYRRLDNEADQQQLALDQLKSDIANALKAIELLEQQKARLEEALKQRGCELKSKNLEHDTCRYQISRGRILKAKTGNLETLALTAGEEGKQVRDTLDRWKNILEECDLQLHTEYLKAQGQSTSLEREIRRGAAARPARRDFERQRAVLLSATTALDGVQMDGGILLLGKKIEVLKDETWEDGRGILLDAVAIPHPCYLTS